MKPLERCAPTVLEETLRVLLLQLQQVILRFMHQLAELGIVCFADRTFQGNELLKQDGAIRQGDPSEHNIRGLSLYQSSRFCGDLNHTSSPPWRHTGNLAGPSRSQNDAAEPRPAARLSITVIRIT